MENPMIPNIEDSYKNSKKKAKLFYETIGRVECPALDGPVDFNGIGFRHLVQKGRKFRPKSEQKRRFALLPYAEAIVREYRGTPEYEKRSLSRLVKSQGTKTVVGCVGHFWALTGERDGKTIRLVIRQLDDGEKHFFSIFEENKKATREE